MDFYDPESPTEDDKPEEDPPKISYVPAKTFEFDLSSVPLPAGNAPALPSKASLSPPVAASTSLESISRKSHKKKKKKKKQDERKYPLSEMEELTKVPAPVMLPPIFPPLPQGPVLPIPFSLTLQSGLSRPFVPPPLAPQPPKSPPMLIDAKQDIHNVEVAKEEEEGPQSFAKQLLNKAMEGTNSKVDNLSASAGNEGIAGEATPYSASSKLKFTLKPTANLKLQKVSFQIKPTKKTVKTADDDQDEETPIQAASIASEEPAVMPMRFRKSKPELFRPDLKVNEEEDVAELILQEQRRAISQSMLALQAAAAVLEEKARIAESTNIKTAMEGDNLGRSKHGRGEIKDPRSSQDDRRNSSKDLKDKKTKEEEKLSKEKHIRERKEDDNRSRRERDKRNEVKEIRREERGNKKSRNSVDREYEEEKQEQKKSIRSSKDEPELSKDTSQSLQGEIKEITGSKQEAYFKILESSVSKQDVTGQEVGYQDSRPEKMDICEDVIRDKDEIKSAKIAQVPMLYAGSEMLNKQDTKTFMVPVSSNIKDESVTILSSLSHSDQEIDTQSVSNEEQSAKDDRNIAIGIESVDSCISQRLIESDSLLKEKLIADSSLEEHIPDRSINKDTDDIKAKKNSADQKGDSYKPKHKGLSNSPENSTGNSEKNKEDRKKTRHHSRSSSREHERDKKKNQGSRSGSKEKDKDRRKYDISDSRDKGRKRRDRSRSDSRGRDRRRPNRSRSRSRSRSREKKRRDRSRSSSGGKERERKRKGRSRSDSREKDGSKALRSGSESREKERRKKDESNHSYKSKEGDDKSDDKRKKKETKASCRILYNEKLEMKDYSGKGSRENIVTKDEEEKINKIINRIEIAGESTRGKDEENIKEESSTSVDKDLTKFIDRRSASPFEEGNREKHIRDKFKTTYYTSEPLSLKHASYLPSTKWRQKTIHRQPKSDSDDDQRSPQHTFSFEKRFPRDHRYRSSSEESIERIETRRGGRSRNPIYEHRTVKRLQQESDSEEEMFRRRAKNWSRDQALRHYRRRHGEADDSDDDKFPYRSSISGSEKSNQSLTSSSNLLTSSSEKRMKEPSLNFSLDDILLPGEGPISEQISKSLSAENDAVEKVLGEAEMDIENSDAEKADDKVTPKTIEALNLPQLGLCAEPRKNEIVSALPVLEENRSKEESKNPKFPEKIKFSLKLPSKSSKLNPMRAVESLDDDEGGEKNAKLYLPPRNELEGFVKSDCILDDALVKIPSKLQEQSDDVEEFSVSDVTSSVKDVPEISPGNSDFTTSCPQSPQKSPETFKGKQKVFKDEVNNKEENQSSVREEEVLAPNTEKNYLSAEQEKTCEKLLAQEKGPEIKHSDSLSEMKPRGRLFRYEPLWELDKEEKEKRKTTQVPLVPTKSTTAQSSISQIHMKSLPLSLGLDYGSSSDEDSDNSHIKNSPRTRSPRKSVLITENKAPVVEGKKALNFEYTQNLVIDSSKAKKTKSIEVSEVERESHIKNTREENLCTERVLPSLTGSVKVDSSGNLKSNQDKKLDSKYQKNEKVKQSTKFEIFSDNDANQLPSRILASRAQTEKISSMDILEPEESFKICSSSLLSPHHLEDLDEKLSHVSSSSKVSSQEDSSEIENSLVSTDILSDIKCIKTETSISCDKNSLLKIKSSKSEMPALSTIKAEIPFLCTENKLSGNKNNTAVAPITSSTKQLSDKSERAKPDFSTTIPSKSKQKLNNLTVSTVFDQSLGDEVISSLLISDSKLTKASSHIEASSLFNSQHTKTDTKKTQETLCSVPASKKEGSKSADKMEMSIKQKKKAGPSSADCKKTVSEVLHTRVRPGGISENIDGKAQNLNLPVSSTEVYLGSPDSLTPTLDELPVSDLLTHEPEVRAADEQKSCTPLSQSILLTGTNMTNVRDDSNVSRNSSVAESAFNQLSTVTTKQCSDLETLCGVKRQSLTQDAFLENKTRDSKRGKIQIIIGVKSTPSNSNFNMMEGESHIQEPASAHSEAYPVQVITSTRSPKPEPSELIWPECRAVAAKIPDPEHNRNEDSEEDVSSSSSSSTSEDTETEESTRNDRDQRYSHYSNRNERRVIDSGRRDSSSIYDYRSGRRHREDSDDDQRRVRYQSYDRNKRRDGNNWSRRFNDDDDRRRSRDFNEDYYYRRDRGIDDKRRSEREREKDRFKREHERGKAREEEKRRRSHYDRERSFEKGRERGRDRSRSQDRCRERSLDRNRERLHDTVRDRDRVRGHRETRDSSFDRTLDNSCDRGSDRTRDKSRERVEGRNRERHEQSVEHKLDGKCIHESTSEVKSERILDSDLARTGNYGQVRLHNRGQSWEKSPDYAYDSNHDYSAERIRGLSPGRIRNDSPDALCKQERINKIRNDEPKETDKKQCIEKEERVSSIPKVASNLDIQSITAEKSQVFAPSINTNQLAVQPAMGHFYPDSVYPVTTIDPNYAVQQPAVTQAVTAYPEGYADHHVTWPAVPHVDPSALHLVQQQYQTMGYPADHALILAQQYMMNDSSALGVQSHFHPPPQHDSNLYVLDPSQHPYMTADVSYHNHFPVGHTAPPAYIPATIPTDFSQPPPISVEIYSHGYMMANQEGGVMMSGTENQFPYESVAEMEAHLHAEMNPDPREAALFGDLPSVRKPKVRKSRFSAPNQVPGTQSDIDKKPDETCNASLIIRDTLNIRATERPEPEFHTSSLAEPSFETSTFAEDILTQSSRLLIGEKKEQEKLLKDSDDVVSSTNSGEGLESPIKEDQNEANPKPLKVKSRWRRSSEAEAVVDTSSPSSTPPPPVSKRMLLESRENATLENQIQNLFEDLDQENVPPPPPLSKRPKMEEETNQLESQSASSAYPVFEEISENIHLTERKRSKSMKRMVCDCTTSKTDRARGIPACGQDCLNRMLLIECGSRCPCLDYCTNKRFQKKLYSKTEAYFAGIGKGWGLRAAENFTEKGIFVMEYVGELLDYKEFVRRTRQYAKQGLKHHYFMALNADELIDATLKGSTSRFMNHSCDPNCETQKWTVNGELRVGFFTKKPVAAGEELTFDYQFEFYGEPQRCYCGAERCRGFIGGQKSLPVRRRKDKMAERRIMEIFEDELLDEDIDSMSQLKEGMRNKDHVLELCRLMVRAEKQEHRLALLQIIQDTSEINCLRLFLGYHGLPLLWSWMVAVGRGNTEEDIALKKEILSVLKKLPITNKTILKESKIMVMVEKWASLLPPPPPPDTEADSLSEIPILPLPVPPDRPVVSILACNKDTKDQKNIKKRVTFADEAASSDSDMSDTTKISSTNGEITCDGTVTTSEFPAPDNSSPEVENNTVTSVDHEKSQNSENENTNKVSETVSLSDTKPPDNTEKNVAESTDQQTVSSESDIAPSEHVTIEQPVGKRRSARKSLTLQTEASKNEVRVTRSRARRRLSGEENNEEVDSTSQLETGGTAEGKNDTEQQSGDRAVLLKTVTVPKRTDVSITAAAISENETFEAKSLPTVALASSIFVDSDTAAKGPDDLSNQASVTKSLSASINEQPATENSEVQALVSGEGNCSDLTPKMNSVSLLPMPISEDATAAEDDEDEIPSGSADDASLRDDSFQDMEEMEEIEETDEISSLAATLLANWIDLKELYKIPKKQRVEERKRTERELESVVFKEPDRPDELDPYAKWKRKKVGKPRRKEVVEDELKKRKIAAIGPKLTKEERRQRFEAKVKAEDEMAAAAEIQRQQDAALMAQQQVAFYYQDPAYAGLHALGSDPSFASTQGQGLDPNLQFSPSVMTPEQQQAAVAAAASLLANPGVTGDASAVAQHLVQQSLYQQDHFQLAGVFPSTQVGQGIQDPTTLHQIALQQMALQQMAVLQQTAGGLGLQIFEEEDVPPPPSPPKVKELLLPPNWKSARDSDGRMYYYHTVTRQTQWELPSWESNSPEDMEFDIPDQEIEEVQSKRKTTTAAADTSSEVAKKIKDQFRKQMSQFVVVYLNPYRKPDCKVGRILATEDFKHLARKLTHHVMAKELKHCRHVEDLEVNENVKAKAKDYVRKYMNRYGPIYKKSMSPQSDDFLS